MAELANAIAGDAAPTERPMEKRCEMRRAESNEVFSQFDDRFDHAGIACYIDEIPEFIEPELERLYGTLHSSLPFFRVFRNTESVSTYVALKGSQPAVILLFQIQGKIVHVLNEMINLEQRELERFASYVFD